MDWALRMTDAVAGAVGAGNMGPRRGQFVDTWVGDEFTLRMRRRERNCKERFMACCRVGEVGMIEERIEE